MKSTYTYGARPLAETSDGIRRQFHHAARFRDALVAVELERRERLQRGEDKAVVAAWNEVAVAAATEAAGWEHDATGAKTRSVLAWGTVAAVVHDCQRAFHDVWDFPAKKDGVCRCKTPFKTGDRIWFARGAHRVLGCPACGSPLRFRAFNGTGRIEMQMQGTVSDEPGAAKGCAAAQLCGEGHSQASMESAGRYRVLRVRIGSLDPNGRRPLWGNVSVNYHRPLPADAAIKYVRVSCWKVGGKERWSVQFVVEGPRACFALPPTTKEAVGVNVGWRIFPDRVRCAVWVDSTGQKGELSLPRRWIDRWEKCEDLQSIESKLLDATRDQLVTARARSGWPTWLVEATATAHAWRAPRRFDALARLLELHMPVEIKRLTRSGDGSNRVRHVDGEQGAIDRIERIHTSLCTANVPFADVWRTVEHWRVKREHLYQWECNRRENTLNERLNVYRHFARQMASYDTVRVPDLDLRDFAELPDGPEHPITTAARPRRFKVALSTLRDAMQNAVMRAGGRWELIDPHLITQTCSVCGREERFDAKLAVRHVCSQCGAEWDQDENGAINTLRAPMSRVVSSQRSQDVDAAALAAKNTRLARLAEGKAKRKAARQEKRSRDGAAT